MTRSTLRLLALTLLLTLPAAAHADLYNYPSYLYPPRSAGNTRASYYRPSYVNSGPYSARVYGYSGVGLTPRYSRGPAPVTYSNYAPCRDSATYSNYAPLRGR